jgi:hypothetical protein
MANRLDLADAQFIGFHMGKWNRDGIIDLVVSMRLTKKEWLKWQEEYLTILDQADIEAVDSFFEKLKGWE